jgi:predicted aspartyl protease
MYVMEEIFSVEKVDDKKIPSSLTKYPTNETINKQNVNSEDFCPEVVVSIQQDNATKQKRIIRALIDTGSTVTVIRKNLLPKGVQTQIKPSTSSRTFGTMAGTVQVKGLATVTFTLLQFAPHHTVTYDVAVLSADNSQLKSTEMIIGRDLIKELGLVLDYSTDTPSINWEGISVPITTRGYWTNTKVTELFTTSVLEEAEKIFESHSPSMVAADYGNKSTSLQFIIPNHLSGTQQLLLLDTLTTYAEVFNGKLGTLPGKPVSLRLKAENVRPYHGRAFAIPKSHDSLIKDEAERLIKLGVLEKCNSSECAAPSFGIPKKNGQIWFVSDFRQLNKHLLRLPFPLPNPQQLFRTMDRFSYCTTMDLNMGFWTIPLDEESKNLCTIVLPWGKYRYLRLPMGLSCSPDIYQEKMSSLFADMVQVIVYIIDICKNIIADFLSRYPRHPDSSPAEIHMLEQDSDDQTFPLDFAVISKAQQTDEKLLIVVGKSKSYKTRKLRRTPIIYYQNRIVVPASLQRRIVTWYHDNLCHPGVTRTEYVKDHPGTLPLERHVR